MAKHIVMNVLTENGYEEMYPFAPEQVINVSFLNTSTSTQYNVSSSQIPSNFTEEFGNSIGILSFVPTISNGSGISLSINGSIARPILFADGTNLTANTLISGRRVLIRYYNNNFYLLLDKSQIGLGNVNNTSDVDKPISNATQTALNNKLNIPIAITRNSNLNDFRTPGLYCCQLNDVAATIANSPTNLAFSLFVEQHAGSKQTLTVYTVNDGIQTWVRNYYNGVWNQWCQQAFVLYGTGEPSSNIGQNGNIYIKIES